MNRIYKSIATFVSKTVKGLLDPYHPENCYMRGRRDDE